jgi:ferric-dicitrate binding protein FerR (iron transport regulator)
MDIGKYRRMAQIISRQLIGTASEEDQLELDEWLGSSEKNRRLYDDLCNDHELDGYEQIMAGQSVDSYMDAIGSIIARRKARRSGIRIAAVAAVLLAGIISATLIHKSTTDALRELPGSALATISLDNGREFELDDNVEDGVQSDVAWRKFIRQSDIKDTSDVHNVKISVPVGGEYELVLDDGTRVWLNSETTIEYPDTFSDMQRSVCLNGEAYFVVEKDSLRPFVVNTASGNIVVLGTSFNVSAYDDDQAMATTLVSGSVEIDNLHEKAVLVPGQQAIISNGGNYIDIREVDTDVYTCWIDGSFEFDKMPLEQVAAKLSRW